MNYKHIYDQIIHKACTENRIKSNVVYFERHHIIPKCLGGDNSKENLVLLLAREHFICHHLLVKIYPRNRKLIHAFWLMCNIKNQYQHNRYIPSSSVYQEARELNNLIGISKLTRLKMSKSHLGQIKSNLTKSKISSSNSKPKERIICPHCLKNISLGTNSTRWHFDNCKSKPGNETLVRNVQITKIITCIHCKICGGENIMKRWHFDNCKNKIK